MDLCERAVELLDDVSLAARGASAVKRPDHAEPSGIHGSAYPGLPDTRALSSDAGVYDWRPSARTARRAARGVGGVRED